MQQQQAEQKQAEQKRAEQRQAATQHAKELRAAELHAKRTATAEREAECTRCRAEAEEHHTAARSRKRESERTTEESSIDTDSDSDKQHNPDTNTDHSATDNQETQTHQPTSQFSTVSTKFNQQSQPRSVKDPSQLQSVTVKSHVRQEQPQSLPVKTVSTVTQSTITRLGPPPDPAPALDRIAELVANMSEQHWSISNWHYQSIQHRHYTQGIGSAHQPSFRDFVPRSVGP